MARQKLLSRRDVSGMLQVCPGFFSWKSDLLAMQDNATLRRTNLDLGIDKPTATPRARCI
jgi:hypothetical protein